MLVGVENINTQPARIHACNTGGAHDELHSALHDALRTTAIIHQTAALDSQVPIGKRGGGGRTREGAVSCPPICLEQGACSSRPQVSTELYKDVNLIDKRWHHVIDHDKLFVLPVSRAFQQHNTEEDASTAHVKLEALQQGLSEGEAATTPAQTADLKMTKLLLIAKSGNGTSEFLATSPVPAPQAGARVQPHDREDAVSCELALLRRAPYTEAGKGAGSGGAAKGHGGGGASRGHAKGMLQRSTSSLAAKKTENGVGV